jgi:hypothetical protein
MAKRLAGRVECPQAQVCVAVLGVRPRGSIPQECPAQSPCSVAASGSPDFGSGRSPAVIVSNWRSVVRAACGRITDVYCGNASARVTSTPRSFPSAIAIPIRVDTMLSPTEKVSWLSSGELPR